MNWFKGQTNQDASSAKATGLGQGFAASSSEAMESTMRLQRSATRFLSVWALIGGLAVAAAVLFLLTKLSAPVGVFIWTVIIVFCLRGVVDFFEKLGAGRLLGTTLAYLIMFCILGIVFMLIFSPASGLETQIKDLIDSIPTYANNINDWIVQLEKEHADLLRQDTVQQWINDAVASFTATTTNFASKFASGSFTGVLSIGSSLVSNLVVIGFSLVIAFWILLELPMLYDEVHRLVDPKHEEEFQIWYVTLTRVMGGYIRGTVIQCLCIGLMAGIWFVIIDVPNSAALAVMVGIINVVPVVGPWIAGILVALVLVFTAPLTALLALVGAVVAHYFVTTFISPRIMQSSVDVHPALNLFSLIVGSSAGGALAGLFGSLVGMLVAIPTAAVIKTLFAYYFEKKTGRPLVSENGVFFKGVSHSSEEGSKVDAFADAIAPHPDVAAVGEHDRALMARFFEGHNIKRGDKNYIVVDTVRESVSMDTLIENIDAVDTEDGDVVLVDTASKETVMVSECRLVFGGTEQEQADIAAENAAGNFLEPSEGDDR